jgi:uncharacterized protein YbaR (Trm112 family)
MSSNDGEPQYADMTTTAGDPLVCKRCGEDATKLFVLLYRDKNKLEASKLVCASCRDHYTIKRDALERERATNERTQSVHVPFSL